MFLQVLYLPLQVSGAVALTVISWPGLLYSFEQKERSLYFETFLKFLGAFRSLNNYKLRILVGGLYNVDLKVTIDRQHDHLDHLEGDSILEVPRLDPLDLLQPTKPKREEGTEVQLCVHQGHAEGDLLKNQTALI